jgi:hypothetical protein
MAQGDSSRPLSRRADLGDTRLGGAERRLKRPMPEDLEADLNLSMHLIMPQAQSI